jgi:ArsR family transcriptional regulator
MLEAARRRLADFRNVEFRQGDLLRLPLEDAEVDAAVVLLVLHHLPEPADVVREVARALKPGGVLLTVDMVAHDREIYRHTMGHQHLGFSEDEVRRWAGEAGLAGVEYRRLRPDPDGKGPWLFAATMSKDA